MDNYKSIAKELKKALLKEREEKQVLETLCTKLKETVVNLE